MANGSSRLIGWTGAGVLIAMSCSDSEPAITEGAAAVLPREVPATPGATSDAGGAASELDAGTSPAALTSELDGLVRAGTANAGAYTEVDRSDLDDLLSLALVHAETPGGLGPASATCASTAVAFRFDRAQAAVLCQDVRYDSAACAAKAVDLYGFDRDSSVALCAQRGSTETADCAATVFTTLGFSRTQAVFVCADRDGADVARCVSSAFRSGAFDRTQTVALCAHRGAATTADCALRALNLYGFSRDQAVALCANRGAPETALCASAAVSLHGFSRDQALVLCANRGQTGNADCAARLLPLGFTRDQAIVACRRPKTTLVP
jgi:hypothetical protein